METKNTLGIKGKKVKWKWMAEGAKRLVDAIESMEETLTQRIDFLGGGSSRVEADLLQKEWNRWSANEAAKGQRILGKCQGS